MKEGKAQERSGVRKSRPAFQYGFREKTMSTEGRIILPHFIPNLT